MMQRIFHCLLFLISCSMFLCSMYETFQKRPSTQEIESNYYPEQVLPATSIVTDAHDLGQAQNPEKENSEF